MAWQLEDKPTKALCSLKLTNQPSQLQIPLVDTWMQTYTCRLTPSLRMFAST